MNRSVAIPLAILTTTLLASGCASPAGETRDPTLPPLPENGSQIVLAEIEIPPSSEVMVCTYATFASDTDQWVKAFRTYQATGGHHVVGFITTENVPDGTVQDCTDPSTMTSRRPLLTGTSVEGFEMPDGLAVKIPARAKLVFQSHYVNATDVAVKARDVVNLWYVDAGVTPIAAASWSTTRLDFAVPPQQEYTASYSCNVPSALSVFIAFGHMHEQGKRMVLEAGPPAAPVEIQRIEPWTSEFRDAPPLIEWPENAPLTLNAGDVIRVHCTWQSTALEPLSFPAEMCAAVFWVYPQEEPLVCVGDSL